MEAAGRSLRHDVLGRDRRIGHHAASLVRAAGDERGEPAALPRIDEPLGHVVVGSGAAAGRPDPIRDGHQRHPEQQRCVHDHRHPSQDQASPRSHGWRPYAMLPRPSARRTRLRRPAATPLLVLVLFLAGCVTACRTTTRPRPPRRRPRRRPRCRTLPIQSSTRSPWRSTDLPDGFAASPDVDDTLTAFCVNEDATTGLQASGRVVRGLHPHARWCVGHPAGLPVRRTTVRPRS